MGWGDHAWQARVCGIRFRRNTNGGPGTREYSVKAILAAPEDKPEWYPGSALHRLNGRECACQRCIIGGIAYQPPPPTRDKRRPKKGDTRHGRR